MYWLILFLLLPPPDLSGNHHYESSEDEKKIPIVIERIKGHHYIIHTTTEQKRIENINPFTLIDSDDIKWKWNPFSRCFYSWKLEFRHDFDYENHEYEVYEQIIETSIYLGK